jgi:6-phosphogluconolactonase (cycloisomerase 2 family)
MRSLVSSDGKFVYTTGSADSAINVYGRNPSNGTLTYLENVKFNEVTSDICLIGAICKIQGLVGAYAMAISPDGKYMYVSGINSNSITVLRRDPSTGSLKYTSAILHVVRPNLAQEILDATNLIGAYDIAMSPDGQYLYAAAYGTALNGFNDSKLTVWKRNPNDGSLALVSGGAYTVAAVPSLKGVFRVTLSPDGNFVYTSSWNSNAVTAFQRDPSTGKLTAISGGVYSDGVSSGVNPHTMTSAAVSPDGKYLFATEYYTGAGSVLVYLRDQTTGELDLLQTITTPDIAGARDVAVAPDGRMIFVTGFLSGKVVGFAIANPVPVLISLDPASVVAGSPQITLTIHGEGFAPGAVATWGGADLAGTQFISPNEVQVPLPANLLGAAGTAQVGVRNPAPAGGNSANTLTFTITAAATPTTPAENPVPSITKIIPNSALAGSPSQEVTVTGQGFIPTSKVLWNGDERTTVYVNGTTLKFTIGASDLLQPGTSGVAVRNPAPGGGVSNVLGFDVVAPGENPSPSIVSISPKSAIAGSVSTELVVTINGLNFIPESQARWEGNARPTTYISPTQLQVAISGGDLLNVGVYSIDVVNPPPGGGTSNSAIFRVGAAGSNPVPAITHADLLFLGGGSAGLQVTLTGTGFVQGATVIWSGVEYTPVSVDATHIVFLVPRAAVVSSTVAVKNPVPGGGLSDTLLVAIPRVALPLVKR